MNAPFATSPALVLNDGQRIELGATNLIGRSPSCTVVISGQKVSRQHTHIYEFNGHFYVADAGSNNGTYLNDIRITHPTRLHSGDVIGIGDHRIGFVSSAASGQVASSQNLTVTDEWTIPAIRQVKTWLLLLDVVGSTQLVRRFSSEDYARQIGAWFKKCRQLVESFRGIVTQSTGDGLLAYWPDEQDARGEEVFRSLVELARLQKQSPVPFRCILHHGTVSAGGSATMGGEPLSGEEVHYLFRVEQALERQVEVALTETASRRLESFCPMFPLAEVPLKGFETKALVFRPQKELSAHLEI
jgi:class 3 adenylate cyclase